MKTVLLGLDILLMAEISAEELGTIEYLIEWMSRIGESPCIDVSTKLILSTLSIKRTFSLIKRLPILYAVERKSRELKIVEELFERTLINPPYLSFVPLGWKKSLAHLSLIQANKVDLYITDDIYIHEIAKKLNIDDRVYSVESYLDRCAAGFRNKDPNKVLAVSYGQFGYLNFKDAFFDSFRRDYVGYSQWSIRKKNDKVFYSKNIKGCIQALLKLKVENTSEEFDDIIPSLPDKRCLKISSFKVNVTGSKLAERFMRLIFQRAIKEKVEAIYVTLFNNGKEKERLVRMLTKWGFVTWGHKINSEEMVMRRDFRKSSVRIYKDMGLADNNIKSYFPFHFSNNGLFLVPLHTSYIDLLLGKNNDENPKDISPLRNSISKVLVVKGNDYGVREGSVLLFYRMTHFKENRGIVGVGVVERVKDNLISESQFVGICSKRSVFSFSHLKDCWNAMADKTNICLIEFLFIDYLDPSEFSEIKLKELGIKLSDLHSQAIIPLPRSVYKKLFENTKYEENYIAD